ncbi:DUF2279 domain-containing protein [Haliangium ochraceum]|uniref:DUF2279 domain-containing protein n=1 Tax=Haliangium ochraceum (strain DSM 14365 / JCM 11303 / SMP-2) TaxID=502025 RepID=D0LSK0_HALO1|nr:DUF2279 domain-containing protein [Haliangium ochraceum]ACY15699.1 hypothetical protein Hoch_3197 [Haliangium ochraceum DSM 14365]
MSWFRFPLVASLLLPPLLFASAQPAAGQPAAFPLEDDAAVALPPLPGIPLLPSTAVVALPPQPQPPPAPVSLALAAEGEANVTTASAETSADFDDDVEGEGEGEGESGLTTGKIVSASIIGGIHATLYTWAYFAWYRPRTKYDELTFIDEGWFGPGTYAGGADKLGHFYSNYLFVRGTVGVLEAGGWERKWALPASLALTLSFFTAIEIKDGYHKGFGFSLQDITANLSGNALAALLLAVPAIDRAIDLRIEYLPSKAFRDELRMGGVDAAEDYTGQSFVLAFHLGSIEPLRRSRYLGWTQYVDVVGGYQARNYKPAPADPSAELPTQELYFGLALDMQAVMRAWDRSVSSPGWSNAIDTTRAIFEFVQVPYTTLELVDAERVNPPVTDESSAGLRW